MNVPLFAHLPLRGAAARPALRAARLLAAALLAGAALAARADPLARPGARPALAAAARHRSETDVPYAFRGIPLGITLDEFRAGSTVRATPLGSVPVCETDVLAGALGMPLKNDESLTVACRWAYRGADGWKVARAVVDGVPALDHVLRFARVKGQGGLRLYEMSFVVDAATADDLRNALASRYGPPHLGVQTAASSGAAMPTYVWENRVSSITLCFLPDAHEGTLTYLLKDPAAWVKSLVRQWQASSVDAS